MRHLVVMLALTLAPLASAADVYSCRALVEHDGDYYLVDPNAPKNAIRFTSDGQKKSDAALAPDAQRISYVANASNEISIASIDGGITHIPFPKNTSMVLATRWDSPTDLAVAVPLGHSENTIDFISIENSKATIEYSLSTSGYGCTRDPSRSHVACMRGDYVWFDDKSAVLADPFDGARVIGQLNLHEGESVPLAGYEPAAVTLVKRDKDGFRIQLGAPDFREDGVVGVGETLVARLNDDAWGVAYVDADADGAASVRIKVLDVPVMPPSASALAWDPSGRTLASGRWIASQSSAALRLIQSNGQGGWQVAKELPLGGDIAKRIRFITSSVLFVSAGESMRIYEVSDKGFTQVAEFKNAIQLAGADDEDIVFDWACSATK